MDDNENIKAGINGSDDLIAVTESMLQDAREGQLSSQPSYYVPIAQLSTLGSAVASVIPVLNKITMSTNLNVSGLYQLANAAVGDTLKVAADGNYWASLRTAANTSKFVKLKAAGPISSTSKIASGINPATLMMAVALFAIERVLGNISETQAQIVSFLQNEKESEIEADIITLTDIITKYKYNWDNERYIASNHKMICDLQRTARKNMISYQKAVADMLSQKKFLIADGKVNSTHNDLLKKFKYYRLSLYIFSLSSLVEIMLSGNFLEANIKQSVDEIEKNSKEYRNLFTQCSRHLEKLNNASVQKNLLKGVSSASNAVGKFIGSIPKVKDGQVDEFLIGAGEKINNHVNDSKKDLIESFSEVSNPNTGDLVIKLLDISRIYNHTREICCDKENVYLIEAKN